MNKNIYKMLLLPILLSVLVACGGTKQQGALQGALVIPDTVSYGGRSYTVSEICAINEQGYFHSETPVISGGNLTEIILPDAVDRLRYSVLRGCTDGEITA